MLLPAVLCQRHLRLRSGLHWQDLLALGQDLQEKNDN